MSARRRKAPINWKDEIDLLREMRRRVETVSYERALQKVNEAIALIRKDLASKRTVAALADVVEAIEEDIANLARK